MRRTRMLWQLYPSYLLITILAVAAVGWYAERSQSRLILEMMKSDLYSKAQLIKDHLDFEMMDNDDIDRWTKAMGPQVSTRITVMLPDGTVIADSEEDPDVMENHAYRFEMKKALGGDSGSVIRQSNTINIRMMYMAVPLMRDGVVAAVVRTSYPMTQVEEAVHRLRMKIYLGGLAVAILAALVSLFVARRFARPLEELKNGARRFAEGNLETHLEVPNSEEIGALAEAMNQMANNLSQRINTINRQRQEQEAILESMAEGVLAVNKDERIININSAAANILHLNPDRIQGDILQEAVRNTALHELVSKILQTRAEASGEIILYNGTEKHIQASGAVLKSADGGTIGAVVVLNDVTLLRQLENIRREFVANVSHELKTPITSIKGYVETLLDGAMKNTEDLAKFLEIISHHSDRLNNIIDDLLKLSQIEQDAEHEQFELAPAKIIPVIEAAIQTCREQAKAKKIMLEVAAGEDIKANINSALMEQALVNLITNAIAYSDPGNKVIIDATNDDNEVSLSVQDFGIGIEPKYHKRIFERFYRIDKARSRSSGGTGLGLAIVKHIALAHRGKVTVKSIPGRGSTFSIVLPSKN